MYSVGYANLYRSIPVRTSPSLSVPHIGTKVLHNVTPIDLLAQSAVLWFNSRIAYYCIIQPSSTFYILKYNRSSDNEFLGFDIG